MNQTNTLSTANLPSDFNLPAFATAMRKLAMAASEHLNADCYTHAALAKSALEVLGVSSEIHVGFAAWRVDGKAPHAVVSHHPQGNVIDLALPHSVMYHAWLRLGTYILDLTTYQLPLKARLMDEADGQSTPVSWSPDYLFVPITTCAKYAQVRDSFKAGVYMYQRVHDLEARLKRQAMATDEADLRTLLVIYQAECQGMPLEVHGPSRSSRLD